jgi:exosortase D (VPLPA-CTERM-specific)
MTQANLASTVAFRRADVLRWSVTIVLALAALVFLSGGSLASLVSWWQNGEGSHGWVVPIIIGIILWQRRHRILATDSAPSWWGFAAIVLGLAVLLVDEVAQLRRFGLPALVLIAWGGTLATLGWQGFRLAAVPIAYLLFAMPPPGPLYVWLSLQLQFISSQIGAAMLHLLGISVFLDGNIIDLGVYKMQVAEACSGLRYLFPLTSFAFLCAWMYRAPLWAKGIVLLSVIPITVMTNSARIAMTGVFIEYGSIELAEGFMHLFEGWVIFLVALAILFGLMWLMARLRGDRGSIVDLLDFGRLSGGHIQPAGQRASDRAEPASLLGLPYPWLAGVALVLLAVPVHTALMDRTQVIPARPGLVTLPTQFGEWRGRPSTIDTETREILKSSDYFLGDFGKGGTPASVNLWIVYYDQQVRNAALHTPKQCLPGGGWEFASHEAIIAPVSNAAGEPFRINRALITNGQRQMLVYYWLEARGGQFASPQLFKASNVRASLFDRRSDGALVRLVTPIMAGESKTEAEARLVEFMTLAYPAFEPHVGF